MSIEDQHVVELTRLAEHYEHAVARWKRDGMSEVHGIAATYTRRAEAIRWLLSLNAYGVDESEVVV